MANDNLTFRGKIVSIEGNIGAGKSTILKELEKRGFIDFPQDVITWKPLLDAFYNTPRRWTFTLQMCILNSLCDQFAQTKYLLSDNAVIFMERAPASSRIFADICKRDGFMTNDEFKIYQGLFDKLIWELDIKLFIDTNVMTCMERISTRGRECEKGIEYDYLEKLAMGYAEYKFDGYFSGSEERSEIVNKISEMVTTKSENCMLNAGAAKTNL